MLNRRKLLQTMTVPAAAGLAAHAWARAGEAALPKVGSSLELAPLALLDGTRWLPAALAGKPLVVYWWASWCPFCAVQSPHIDALWRAQKANGLAVLGLSIDREQAAAVSYMKAKGYAFPSAWLGAAASGGLAKPAGLPVVVVLRVAADGTRGQVLFAEAGEMFPEDIEGLKKYI